VTLRPPLLDDLTWGEMMAAIRRRIPAESGGSWTLHAPVDPGVTLLELLAWLLEQRLYWLDQIPDSLVVGVLRLLGVGGPLPARLAGTVLQVEADGGAGPFVPAHTAFRRDTASDPRGEAEVVFTIDTGVTVLPVTAVRLTAGGRDRTDDLLARRGVALLAADGRPSEALLELELAAPVGAAPGGWLSLLLELATPDRVPPAWHPDAVPAVPPPARITWWHRDDGGEPVQFGPAEVDDGTQGLRRSGVVRLRLPDPWRAAAAGARRLLLRTDRATFAAPPRLLQLTPNVAAARHCRRVSPSRDEREALEREVREQWLPLPGIHLDLPGARGQLLGARLRLRERDGWHPWTATTDLAFHGRTDRVFVVDREAGALRFGDGRTGRIPVPARGDDAARIRVRWEVGGGAPGNSGTSPSGGGPNWHALDLVGVTARNLVPAAGGVAPETIEQARRRAADALREPHRAVTGDDHVTVARLTPGVAVARAHAAIGDHPGFPCATVPGAVSVYVVPEVPRGEADWDRPDFVAEPHPDPGMRQAVCSRLADARLVGAEVFLRDPRYRPVRLRVELSGVPADPAGVRRRLRDRLRRYLDPLTGGDDGGGRRFGEPLRPSALLRVAQQAAGSDGEVTAVAIAAQVQAGGDGFEDCVDVPVGENELVVLEDVRVRFGTATEPGPVESEGLQ